MGKFLQIFDKKVRQLNCKGYKNRFERSGFFGFMRFLCDIQDQEQKLCGAEVF
jgi:hypothetical protein